MSTSKSKEESNPSLKVKTAKPKPPKKGSQAYVVAEFLSSFACYIEPTQATGSPDAASSRKRSNEELSAQQREQGTDGFANKRRKKEFCVGQDCKRAAEAGCVGRRCFHCCCQQEMFCQHHAGRKKKLEGRLAVIARQAVTPLIQ